MQKIYTTGYGGKNIADLKPMLDALDAVLIDIDLRRTAIFCTGRKCISKFY